MGLKLLILSWWTPKYIIRKELANVSDRTTTALKMLIVKNASKEVDFADQKQEHPSSIQEQRAIMAQTHAKLVEKLEAIVGRKQAVKLGRQALFSVGQNLGKQSRIKLGVGDNPKDLTRAAKILYRVLGIDFRLKWVDSSNAVAIIDRCALSEQYSELTCAVLSATDEGVIKGFQPNVTMNFREFMTGGCKNCRAEIHFK